MRFSVVSIPPGSWSNPPAGATRGVVAIVHSLPERRREKWKFEDPRQIAAKRASRSDSFS